MVAGVGGQGLETHQYWVCGSVCDRDWVSNLPSGRGSPASVEFEVREGARVEKIRSSSYPQRRYRVSSVGMEWQKLLASPLSGACLQKVVSKFVAKEEVGWK